MVALIRTTLFSVLHYLTNLITNKIVGKLCPLSFNHGEVSFGKFWNALHFLQGTAHLCD